MSVDTQLRDEIYNELVNLHPTIDWMARNSYMAATWDAPMSAVELLPCLSAWACVACGKIRTNYRRMITHVREHGDSTAKPVQVTVQTIGSLRKSNEGLHRLVPVHDPIKPRVAANQDGHAGRDVSGALDQVYDLMNDIEPDLVITGQGARHLSEFHRSVDWADVMETVGLPYLANLGRRDVLPTDPVWMQVVHKIAPKVFEQMYRSLDKYKYHPFRSDLQR